VAGELRGWHPDPFNAHERRYYSMDGMPTRLVSDSGRTSHDPPLPTPLGSGVGPGQPKRTVHDQRQSPPSVPQSGANTVIAPGSIAFPPLAAMRDGEPDRPAIGQIYQSVGSDERRTELNSTAPAAGGHEEARPPGRKPELLDLVFPNASPARRAMMQRFVRYGSVSVISTLLGLAILSVLIGAVGYPAVWSNVIAVGIATVPSFELNRRWVWVQNGERSILRQAVPYFVLSFAGLVISTLAVHVASDATIHSSRLIHTGAAEVANVASYGTLWLLQFLLCDRILFRSPSRGPRLSDRLASLKRLRSSEEIVRVEALSNG
jgi:putative flippase GtrA